VAIVSMAVSAASAGAGSPDGPSLLGGAALLILAAAAPFTLLRMVPVVEAGVVAHLEGLSHRAASPPAVVTHAVQQAALQRVLHGREESADEGPPSGPTGPPPGASTPVAVPTRGRDPDGTQSGPDKPIRAAPATSEAGGSRAGASGAIGSPSSPSGEGAAGGPLLDVERRRRG
jgi:hypothetical protein